MNIPIKNAKEIGIQLAYIHNQPILDLRRWTRLDGQYLNTRSQMLNMPFYSEIQEAIAKTDNIVQKITSIIPNPFVKLWNQYEECIDSIKNVYGNPGWDLGIVINTLGDNSHAEDFMWQYLNNQGICVTIIELYSGILYAKLNAAISNQHTVAWEQLAKNECASLIHGNGLIFKEIYTETLAKLGLPGLQRI